MTEPVELRLKASPVQLILAVAVCAGLFLAGFGLGRLSKDARRLQSSGLTTSTNVEEPEAASPVTAPERESSESGDGISLESLRAGLDQLTLSDVQFVLGTDQLTAEGQAVLADVAAVLLAHPFIPVEVEIRTYTEATPGENHGLSTQQAQAVAAHLVADGVQPGRLASVGLGAPSGPPSDRRALLLLETTSADLAEALGPVDSLAVDLDPDGQISSQGRQILDELSQALAAHPESPLRLVGYAYADTPTASHEQAHDLIDTVVAHLVAQGTDESRLTTVGLGDSPVSLGLETNMDLEVGYPAAIALALAQLDGDRITFEPHSDRLTTEGQIAMNEVAATMSLDPTSTIEISAHTYSEPTSQSNHDLSQLQGKAVVAALVDAGIHPDRLEMVGHGDPPHFALPGRDTYITFYPTD